MVRDRERNKDSLVRDLKAAQERTKSGCLKRCCVCEMLPVHIWTATATQCVCVHWCVPATFVKCISYTCASVVINTAACICSTMAQSLHVKLLANMSFLLPADWTCSYYCVSGCNTNVHSEHIQLSLCSWSRPVGTSKHCRSMSQKMNVNIS